MMQVNGKKSSAEVNPFFERSQEFTQVYETWSLYKNKLFINGIIKLIAVNKGYEDATEELAALVAEL